MWLPPGSFWTEPAGEPHITAADDARNLAYIEINDGPYRVLSAAEAFDNGERPINVHASNLVWVDTPGKAEVFYLWEDAESGLRGTPVRLPTGFVGEMQSGGAAFRAVVIQGRPAVFVPDEGDNQTLQPGSYFGSSGEETYKVCSGAGATSILYVHTAGDLIVAPTRSKR